MAAPSLRRLIPGRRLDASFNWPAEAIDNLDSSFHVQEYLQQLIRQDHTNINTLIEIPDSVDRQVWQYEHLRQVCIELNQLVVALECECTQANCPEMKADGWLYLCAAHPTTQSCPAIDYIIHTLDGATILLNNSKYFPSRQVNTFQSALWISIPEPSLKHFQAIARRLYRVFAHAYFHHRETYDLFENETCLYGRFLLLSKTFNLVPTELISIPSDANLDHDENEQADDDDLDEHSLDDTQSQVTAIED
ncbi:putative cell cycle-associated protein [Hesseltinella vesiculosa]|uniref:Putative cell cycle-associated protein n=1 Tax=Hesseltinella vesiculosa TaxID=101127 RepID=A0A1X2G639_9FUNG|nr:putative cell cycle-associated protein [Hesseltinella vesiculosa]